MGSLPSGPAGRSSPRFPRPSKRVGRPKAKKRAPVSSQLRILEPEVVHGCVRIQYAACIASSPANAPTVSQKAAVPPGIRKRRAAVRSSAAGSAAPPMVSPDIDCLHRQILFSRQSQFAGQLECMSKGQCRCYRDQDDRENFYRHEH